MNRRSFLTALGLAPVAAIAPAAKASEDADLEAISAALTNPENVQVHYSVGALDAEGVRQWFHDNAEHVASALSKAVRNGDHFGIKGPGLD